MAVINGGLVHHITELDLYQHFGGNSRRKIAREVFRTERVGRFYYIVDTMMRRHCPDLDYMLKWCEKNSPHFGKTIRGDLVNMVLDRSLWYFDNYKIDNDNDYQLENGKPLKAPKLRDSARFDLVFFANWSYINKALINFYYVLMKGYGMPRRTHRVRFWIDKENLYKISVKWAEESLPFITYIASPHLKLIKSKEYKEADYIEKRRMTLKAINRKAYKEWIEKYSTLPHWQRDYKKRKK